MATWFTTIVRVSMAPMEITFSSLYIASKHRTPAASRASHLASSTSLLVVVVMARIITPSWERS